MMSRPGSQAGVRHPRGYSLIELLVVLAVIVLISLASLPNIFGRNDRLSLETSANRIRQLLIDAKTRSLAPTGREEGALGQIFQVSIGDFQSGGQSNYTAAGTSKTTSLVLERGSSRCDPSDDQGGFTQIRDLKLPRNIYISSFFPAKPSATDTKAVIRFAVGKVGFNCGFATDPSVDSTNFNDFAWIGKAAATPNQARARYLVITVSAQKLSEKRYVVIDRQTSEITVTRDDPQAYFVPLSDALVPKWQNVDPANFNLSLSCGNGQPSQMVLTFPRAEDRVTDANQTDPNLAVFYDISWNINGEQQNGQPVYRPLAIRYYYDVRSGFETVRYEFETTAVSVAHQKFNVIVNVAASDQGGLIQNPYQAGAPDEIERQRQKTFLLDCGNGAVKTDDDTTKEQADPDIINESCLQQQVHVPMLRPGRYALLWWYDPRRQANFMEGEACT
jgi:prepilin-type N-terminal cleavage/methylation domain-containing protein